MKKLIKYSLLMVPVLLSGCEKDESLSPSLNGKSVAVAVKIPHEIDVLPLGVMYRSNKCLKKRSNANGESYDVPGFHFTEINLKQVENSDLFESQVPFDGGGNCQWQLSNVTIGIKYKSPSYFAMDIKENYANEIIFVFDENEAQRTNWIYEDVSGDKEIIRDYYPMITNRYINGFSRELSIYGLDSKFTYRMYNTNKIIYQANVHSNKLVFRDAPKKQGGDFSIKYPDGSIVVDDSIFPDLKKLQSIH
ncbi:Uncharacterised protein [Yersinia mollaretii]|uniref:hypothetical protein n=1 Tax=Yersinia mollaretii TaxID=33060 RepID=UPI0005DD5699|nr:hypothetical protein [Yersinia mollaretii]CNL12492.1 Uncharacterised protein [Yersinia mollaretii]